MLVFAQVVRGLYSTHTESGWFLGAFSAFRGWPIIAMNVVFYSYLCWLAFRFIRGTKGPERVLMAGWFAGLLLWPLKMLHPQWADADRFLENLKERLGMFGLELHPDKTRRIEFGRFAEENRRRRGEGKPETFDFLGFTHISGKNRLGRFTVRRKTIRKRMRAKLRDIQQQIRERMHDPVRQTGQWLKSIVQGHFNYYAVPGNLDSLGVFRDRLIGQWWRTLRRRSQTHPIPWTRTLALAERWFPQPRVLHPYPAVRFAASHPR